MNVAVIGLTRENGNGGSGKKTKTSKPTGDVDASDDSWESVGKVADEQELEEHPELEAAAEEHGLVPDQYQLWERLGFDIDQAIANAEGGEEEEEVEEESEPSTKLTAAEGKEYIGYEADMDDGQGNVITVEVTKFVVKTQLFTVVDDEESEYDVELSDLDFGEDE